MAKEKFVIRGVEFPTNINMKVFARVLSESEMIKLLETYKSGLHRVGSRTSTPPNADQLRAAKLRKEGKNTRQIAEALGITGSQAESYVRKVALYNFMQS